MTWVGRWETLCVGCVGKGGVYTNCQDHFLMAVQLTPDTQLRVWFHSLYITSCYQKTEMDLSYSISDSLGTENLSYGGHPICITGSVVLLFSCALTTVPIIWDLLNWYYSVVPSIVTNSCKQHYCKATDWKCVRLFHNRMGVSAKFKVMHVTCP